MCSNLFEPKVIDRIRNQRVGVCLSSGFFGFYHQAGVLAALEEYGIRPHGITGTSAGALVAALYAAGLPLPTITEELLALGRKSFWDLHWPFTKSGFGLLAGYRFKSKLAELLPVHSFEECEIPLTVGAYDLTDGRVRHLSKGPLIPAVYASCAYPYLFPPEKMNGTRLWDGGFGEKCALVPFLEREDIDLVILSYMPKNETERSELDGIGAFIPPWTSFFADTPIAERRERDIRSIEVLEDAGKQVLIFAPERVRLGPFSLHKGLAAFEKGRVGTLRILQSRGDEKLGSPRLARRP